MKAFIREYLRLHLVYLRPHWRRMVVLFVVMLASIALGVIAPLIVSSFIDSVRAREEAQTLLIAGIGFIGVGLLASINSAITSIVSAQIAWLTTNRMRAELVLHVLKLDMSYHNDNTAGEIMERVEGDISAMARLFSMSLVQLISGVLLTIGILIGLGTKDYRLSLTVLVLGVFIVAVYTFFQRVAIPHFRTARQTTGDFMGHISETLSGVPDIQTSGAIDYVLRRFYDLNRKDYWANARGSILNQNAEFMSEVFYWLSFGAAIAMGIYLFQNDQVTLGTIFLVIQYMPRLHQPLTTLSSEVGNIQKSRVSLDRINQLFDTRSAVEQQGDTPLPSGPVSVEFDDVSFSYNNRAQVLRDVSFTIEPGKVMGLLGRTGSGKTTISRLLFRLYDVDRGAVRMGGVDPRTTPLDDLRSRVGMVTQEVQLFQANLRDNLTLFDDTIPDDRIIATIEDLGLGAWYAASPDGLDTEITSGGGRLSAGEAQLVAFARVFLRDPDVVVLDEASSRLDLATERLIERAIDKLVKGRTVVIIAHRLATVLRSDTITIIDNGQVQEHGARAALMEDEGSRFSELLATGLEEVLT